MFESAFLFLTFARRYERSKDKAKNDEKAEFICNK